MFPKLPIYGQLRVWQHVTSCFLLILVASVFGQRMLNNAQHRNPASYNAPQQAALAPNQPSYDGSTNRRKKSDWLDTLSDKLFGEPNRPKKTGENTMNRNLEKGRELEVMNRRGGSGPNEYDGAQRGRARPSSTMPILIIFLMIVAVCVVVVWIESNYGILESLFRIVSPDDERSSVEERLEQYGGPGPSSRRRDKKSKRKRKSRKSKHSNEDSDDEDDDDSEERRRKSRKKRHRRKSSGSSKSSASKSSKSRKKKQKQGQSDDSSSG